MRTLLTFLSFALLICSLSAVQPVQLLLPNTQITEGTQLDYGTVGPGQTFSFKIAPIVNDPASGNYLGRWDLAMATDLPQGWRSRPSGLYGNPLELEVTVDPMATDGDYTLRVVVEDENFGDHIGDRISFDVIVHVRTDVLKAEILPLHQETGAGQPARYTITLTNLGTAPDTFRVGTSGVRGWSYQTNEYIGPGATKTFNYEVVGSDEAYYPLVIKVESFSSPKIRFEQPVSLQVRTNLGADYRATSHGVLLYPPVLLPIYSLAGILGLVFP